MTEKRETIARWLFERIVVDEHGRYDQRWEQLNEINRDYWLREADAMLEILDLEERLSR
jgi:hypothetical protein